MFLVLIFSDVFGLDILSFVGKLKLPLMQAPIPGEIICTLGDEYTIQYMELLGL